MPQVKVIPGTKALPMAQKGFREGYKTILRPAAEQIGTVLNRYAGLDGKIDPKRERQVLTAVGQIIDRVFVGYDGRNAYAEDGASPLSPFGTLVNRWVAYVTIKAVQNQRNWMRRNVPEDVFNWLKTAKRPELVRETVSMSARANPVFAPNKLAKYDPLHKWVDPNGYTLSDRVWRTDVDMRARLDAMLAEQIRNGNSAFNISKKAEQFMLPGRAALRTDKPYGKDASYRGMVLGRTEITRAHGEATLISARLNPYVEGMDWALSGSHPKMDICDSLATIGMGGNRIKEPYDVGSVPSYPPHPQCVLPGQMITTIGGDVPIEDIQLGDLVLTHKGRYQVVQSYWHNPYEGMIYQIETDNGTIEITPEHPVMTLRGWVNAKDLQPTDYVLNTSVNIGIDGSFGIVENCPSQLPETGISDGVLFLCMPIDAVAFDSNLGDYQGKVQPETFNTVLGDKVKAVLGQRLAHGYFDSGLALVIMEALHGAKAAGRSITGFDFETLAAVETSDESAVFIPEVAHPQMDKSGVIDLFDSGYFGSDLWPTCGVGISRNIKPLIGFSHGDSSTLAAISGISPSILDTGGNGFGAHSVDLEQGAEHAPVQPKYFAYRGTAEILPKVEIAQEISDRLPVFGFQLESDVFNFSHIVDPQMQMVDLNHLLAANVANFHDNLLSSSPECEEGAASGNAVVGRVIRPSQAHLHYSKIRRISTREYSGFVYNMHVEQDNSYTVNGMAVHNCLCTISSVVVKTPAQVTEELRQWMQGDLTADGNGPVAGGMVPSPNNPPITPAADDTLLWMLLGEAFYQWVQLNMKDLLLG